MKLSEFCDLSLGLAQSLLIRKDLSKRLSFSFVSKPEVGAVTGIAGPGTATTGLAAFSDRGADTSGAKVLQACDSIHDPGTLIG